MKTETSLINRDRWVANSYVAHQLALETGITTRQTSHLISLTVHCEHQMSSALICTNQVVR